MTGQRMGRGVRAVVTTSALALVLLAVGAGCSKSGSSGSATASSTTTVAPANEAALDRGITLVIEPSSHPRALAIPAGFLACTAAKLPVAARAAVASVKDGSNVPGNVAVYVTRAGSACNRAFLTASIARSMTDSSSGSALTAAQAACASPRAVAALLRLDPTKVSASTDDNAAVRALLASVDGCAPFEPIVEQSLRSSIPGITPAQLACVRSKSTIKTWAAMAAAGSSGLGADLQAATKACGVG